VFPWIQDKQEFPIGSDPTGLESAALDGRARFDRGRQGAAVVDNNLSGHGERSGYLDTHNIRANRHALRR
jgi:hypothetical protein